jgi:hypothetical protein
MELLDVRLGRRTRPSAQVAHQQRSGHGAHNENGGNQPRVVSGEHPTESKGTQTGDKGDMEPGNANENLQRSVVGCIRKAH